MSSVSQEYQTGQLALKCLAATLCALIITIGSCQTIANRARYEYLQETDPRILLAEMALSLEASEESGFRHLWDRANDRECDQLIEYRRLLLMSRLLRYKMALSVGDEKQFKEAINSLPIKLPTDMTDLEEQISQLKTQFNAEE